MIILVLKLFLSSPQLTVNVTGGNSPYTYLWNTGETTSSITPINNGNFYVDVQDANNCLGSDSITVNFVGIENDFIYEFEIFPNPSNENIILSSNFQIDNLTKINIYNLTGKLVLSENVDINNGSSENINVSLLVSGVYLLEIKNSFLINQMFHFIKK